MIGIAGQVVEGQDGNRGDVGKLERILGLVGRREVWLEPKPLSKQKYFPIQFFNALLKIDFH